MSNEMVPIVPNKRKRDNGVTTLATEYTPSDLDGLVGVDRRRVRNKILARKARQKSKITVSDMVEKLRLLKEENKALLEVYYKVICPPISISELVADDIKLPECIQNMLRELPFYRADACTDAAFNYQELSFCILSGVSSSFPIVYASAAFLALSGFDRADVLGKPVTFLADPLSSSYNDMVHIERALCYGKDASFIVESRRGNGDAFLDGLSLSHLKDEHGRTFLIIATHKQVQNQRESGLDQAFHGGKYSKILLAGQRQNRLHSITQQHEVPVAEAQAQKDFAGALLRTQEHLLQTKFKFSPLNYDAVLRQHVFGVAGSGPVDRIQYPEADPSGSYMGYSVPAAATTASSLGGVVRRHPQQDQQQQQIQHYQPVTQSQLQQYQQMQQYQTDFDIRNTLAAAAAAAVHYPQYKINAPSFPNSASSYAESVPPVFAAPTRAPCGDGPNIAVAGASSAVLSSTGWASIAPDPILVSQRQPQQQQQHYYQQHYQQQLESSLQQRCSQMYQREQLQQQQQEQQQQQQQRALQPPCPESFRPQQQFLQSYFFPNSDSHREKLLAPPSQAMPPSARSNDPPPSVFPQSLDPAEINLMLGRQVGAAFDASGSLGSISGFTLLGAGLSAGGSAGVNSGAENGADDSADITGERNSAGPRNLLPQSALTSSSRTSGKGRQLQKFTYCTQPQKNVDVKPVLPAGAVVAQGSLPRYVSTAAAAASGATGEMCVEFDQSSATNNELYSNALLDEAADVINLDGFDDERIS